MLGYDSTFCGFVDSYFVGGKKRNTGKSIVDM